jgi:phosphoribosylanthranilate isomerase
VRTRIKICGLTREADVDAAVAAGADAIGLVFYPKSPRYVSPERAAELARRIPPFVTIVALFVNAAEEEIDAVLERVPVHLLQFHGDETEAQCRRWRIPYIKAARVRLGVDLVQYAIDFDSARGILLDAFVEGYGGGGKTFDWSMIPADMPRPIVLSGGLNPDNVGEAVRRLRPPAVDVSSGVEAEKGIKDAAKIAAFIAAVRAADQQAEDA